MFKTKIETTEISQDFLKNTLNINSMGSKKTKPKSGPKQNNWRKRVIELYEKKKPTKLELELAHMYLITNDRDKKYTKRNIASPEKRKEYLEDLYRYGEQKTSQKLQQHVDKYKEDEKQYKAQEDRIKARMQRREEKAREEKVKRVRSTYTVHFRILSEKPAKFEPDDPNKSEKI